MTAHPIPPLQVENIQLQVAERLGNIEPLRTLGNYLQIKLNDNGVIEISGPTQSRLVKEMVLQTIRDIPGIKGVEDHIITDPDLELAIAWGLVQDDRTRDLPPGSIFVRSHLGVVTLFGKLPSGFLTQDIIEVVSSVGGVRGVQDKLQI